MYDSLILLCSPTLTRDTSGRDRLTYDWAKAKELFAEVRSISQTEFYSAAQSDLRPEYKFVISDWYDYGGEDRVRYEGREYTVIRTFRDGMKLEIVVKREVQNG